MAGCASCGTVALGGLITLWGAEMLVIVFRNGGNSLLPMLVFFGGMCVIGLGLGHK
jgi:hypothetical protein